MSGRAQPVPLTRPPFAGEGNNFPPKPSALISNQVSAFCREWFCELCPALLTHVIPASLAPSRVIPYQSLHSDAVLRASAFPDHLPEKKALQIFFNALIGYDAMERIGKELSIASGMLVLIPKSCPKYVVKMKNPFQKQRLGAKVKRAHFYAETKDGNILRVIMTQRMRGVIEAHRLDRLHMPGEWLFPLKNFPNPIDTDYAVIAEKEELLSIDESQEKMRALPFDEAEQILTQLYRLIHLTGYQDARIDNIRFNREGKLVICDSEPLGLVDLSRRASYIQHRLGVVRDQEIDAAMYGMGVAGKMDRTGLRFPLLAIAGVGREFREIALEEKRINAVKRRALVGLGIFMHAAALASTFYCVGCRFSDSSEPH